MNIAFAMVALLIAGVAAFGVAAVVLLFSLLLAHGGVSAGAAAGPATVSRER